MNAASRFEMNFVFLQNYLTKAVAIADAELMDRLASCAIFVKTKNPRKCGAKTTKNKLSFKYVENLNVLMIIAHG